MTLTHEQLQACANTIRGLAMDSVQRANSGHPGMPMGMADVAAVLWLEHLRFVPEEPLWRGRDRFVLSAGHGSMLLYSLLHLAGFDVTLEDLKDFRQLGSKTPGHPEFGITVGVETTTGPLGQGFANGVGLALGAQMECERFDCSPLRTRVFGIVSDGDLMEGIAYEAASIAGHLRLDNLVYLWDDNEITIDGRTDRTFDEDVEARFKSMHWRVLSCDGHDFDSIRAALAEASRVENAPVLIRCRTKIGKGSPNKEDSSSAHGAPLGTDEIAATKKALGLPAEDFHVPDEVYALFTQVADSNRRARNAWNDSIHAWRQERFERAERWQAFCDRKVPENLFAQLLESVDKNKPMATRALSGTMLQAAYPLIPSLVGGSADLVGSTKTDYIDNGHISPSDRKARNIAFGIREHAMAAILNGLALHGTYLPLGSTFLVFSDYCRPSVRLAALMQLPVSFVFTHDSVMVGEDGPTHQPIEQAAALRLIPGLHVWRPADAVETAAAWTAALQRRDGPAALLLTRQTTDIPTRDSDVAEDDALRGGYVVHEPEGAVATIIGTGSEAGLARLAADVLATRGKPMRVVSIPCIEAFVAQPDDWQSKVLPSGHPTFAVELGRPEPFVRFTGRVDHVIGLDHFGESGPHNKLRDHFGFTPEKVADRIANLLG